MERSPLHDRKQEEIEMAFERFVFHTSRSYA